MDDEIREVVETLRKNGGSSSAVVRADKAYDFAKLGQQIADSMEAAAEEQLAQAQNNLDHIREFANALRSKVFATNRELVELNARLQSFGQTILEAHRQFNE